MNSTYQRFNINPDPSKRTNAEITENFWAKNKEGKYILDVENYNEEDVLTLGNIDFEACRFEITNMTQRLCTCTVHQKEGFAHGFRLHPPHLWNIVDGKLFKKIDGKWVRFLPKPEPRLEEPTKR